MFPLFLITRQNCHTVDTVSLNIRDIYILCDETLAEQLNNENLPVMIWPSKRSTNFLQIIP